VVVLFHERDAAVCMKATSQTGLYRNNPELMAGCVLYRAGEVRAFSTETVIQADNLFAIFHKDLCDPNRVVGPLPADFHEKIMAAIRSSVRLDENWKRKLLSKLEKP